MPCKGWEASVKQVLSSALGSVFLLLRSAIAVAHLFPAWCCSHVSCMCLIACVRDFGLDHVSAVVTELQCRFSAHR